MAKCFDLINEEVFLFSFLPLHFLSDNASDKKLKDKK